jgi:predicted nucleic acid-binding protein
MIIYLDTNVLLSLHTKNDLNRELNEQILTQSDLTFITSLFTLLEYKNVLGRLWRENKLILKPEVIEIIKDLPESDKIQVIFDRLLAEIPVTVYGDSLVETLKIRQKECHFENNLHLAYRLAFQLQLRTADLIQIAFALNIKILNHMDIDYFLTNDDQILSNNSAIRNLTGFIPVSSVGFKDLLRLDE